MKDIFKLGGLLMLITAIAAGSLAGVYKVTKPLIEEEKRKAEKEAQSLVLPGAALNAIFSVGKDSQVLYYAGYKDSTKQELVGYAFVAAGSGYSSVIETMVGVDTSGAILGMKVLKQVETPGLGTKVEEIKYGEKDAWFTRQFLAKSAAGLNVEKDGGEIQAITGATISSRAVAKSVSVAYAKLLSDKSTVQ